MADNLSLVQVHIGRKQLYYYLARVFLDVPDEDLYLYTEEILPAFEILSKHNKPLETGFMELASFVKKRLSTHAEERKIFDNGLLNDYSALFCKPDSLSLYQSMYIAPYGENIKESLYNIQKQYGFEIGEENIDLADHISYELSFLGYLAGITAYNIQKENLEMASHLLDVQIDVLDNYMLSWIEHLMYAMANMPEGALFYSPVCSIVYGFLEYDRFFLKKNHL